MFIISIAYDDNTAEVLELPSQNRKYMTEQELINFSKHNEVLGLSAGNKINYIQPYSAYLFPSEDEAYFYIKNNNLSYNSKHYVGEGYYAVVEKNNNKRHVDYFVYCCSGPEITYVGKNRGTYVPYKQSAKTFTKHEAQKTAALMTRKSKTGKYWTVERVVY